mgnify:CR=1 FL=1
MKLALAIILMGVFMSGFVATGVTAYGTAGLKEVALAKVQGAIRPLNVDAEGNVGAGSATGVSVTPSEIATDVGVEENDIASVINDIDVLAGNRPISGFASITYGHGYALAPDGGNAWLLRGFWASKQLALDPNDPATSGSDVVMRGMIRVGMRGTISNYALSLKEKVDANNAGQLTFSLLNENGNVAGSLELTRIRELAGLTFWEGTYTSSEEASGAVTFVTMSNSLRNSVKDGTQPSPDTVKEIEIGQGPSSARDVRSGDNAAESDGSYGIEAQPENSASKSKGFWARLFGNLF